MVTINNSSRPMTYGWEWLADLLREAWRSAWGTSAVLGRTPAQTSWNNSAVAFLRRNSGSDVDEPTDDLAMTIKDVVWITPPPPGAKLDRRQRKLAAMLFPGTVLVGELTGGGTLRPGDFVVHEQGRFKIERIEAFHEVLDHVQPPRNIGLKLGTGVDRELFAEGQEIRFER
jgi:hypothetical protein